MGAEVVRALAEAGEPVRALSRSGRAEGLSPGVEAVAGDLASCPTRWRRRTRSARATRCAYLSPAYARRTSPRTTSPRWPPAPSARPGTRAASTR
ncbi:hypothetical protein [Streptomyces sp. DT2A-34]|uniref:hypothetical protein n=1 Tax=Streptomyces sp. DT2A-34 TaxID=3051182 RepID=UPI003464BF15